MAASVSVTRAAVFVAGCDDSRSLLAPAIALMNVSFRIKRRLVMLLCHASNCF